MTGDERVTTYLIYLMGCVLFVDKTQTKVPQIYLCITQTLERVPKLAWGTTTLAYLYDQLGKASRANIKQLAGGWIYEYFPAFRRAIKPVWVEGSPRASRWEKLTNSGNSFEELIKYRQILNNMTPDDVTWIPYGGQYVIPPESYYQGVKAYKKDFGDSDEAWILWTTEVMNTVNPSVMGPEVTYASQVADDYMELFRKHSHVRVSNPIHDGVGTPPPTVAAQPYHTSMAQV
ncbi:hypothetical protein LIER_10431 [Lithospermum erythrorhizon]|uniref:Aminotransferase-like plant mobile domain-containing protein n=1 Tax=Lithospermum erythrorhizon TaxID=34254 RepID=A0AAV3PLJ3_LITER